MATCPDRDRVGFDSYARHSVAPKPPPPSGFHQLPQTEEDASESSRSSECCTPSTDNERRRVMKRKVLRYPRCFRFQSQMRIIRVIIRVKICHSRWLERQESSSLVTGHDGLFSSTRKHKGQSLVCDESVYTEDSGSIHLNIFTHIFLFKTLLS